MVIGLYPVPKTRSFENFPGHNYILRKKKAARAFFGLKTDFRLIPLKLSAGLG
jgi:hypothetical protein